MSTPCRREGARQAERRYSDSAKAQFVDPWHQVDARGRLADELPFLINVEMTTAAEIASGCGLPPVSPSGHAACLALIANLVYAAARGSAFWIFYSRDRNHYAEVRQKRRKPPLFYNLRDMTKAVQVLEEAGRIVHRKTAPSPFAEFRSRVRPSELFLRSMGRIYAKDFVFAPTSVLVLRDKAGRDLAFADSRDRARMERDVLAQNDFLADFHIEVAHPQATYDDRGFLILADGRWVNPERRRYCRVFNRNFSGGGRWYGPYWQSLPGHIRNGIRINGQATVEVDYASCHPRLLCALSGLTLPFHDPGFDFYAIPGFPRAEIKLAFNIMLNASSEGSALGAISEEFRDRGINPPAPRARQVMSAIMGHYRGLEAHWNTGIGLRLQNFDATICARVQRKLRKAAAPVLSIHDSFIVPCSFEPCLTEVMDTEMERMIRHLFDAHDRQRKSAA